jgi:hypothetical protein
MANYYQKKPKARFLIPLVVILLIVSVLMFSCSVFMSRRTRYVIDESTLKLAQLEEPKAGDTVAVIKTSLGDISVRLYPEYAPNTVENFISLAEKDYYDNTISSIITRSAECKMRNQITTHNNEYRKYILYSSDSSIRVKRCLKHDCRY